MLKPQSSYSTKVQSGASPVCPAGHGYPTFSVVAARVVKVIVPESRCIFSLAGNGDWALMFFSLSSYIPSLTCLRFFWHVVLVRAYLLPVICPPLLLLAEDMLPGLPFLWFCSPETWRWWTSGGSLGFIVSERCALTRFRFSSSGSVSEVRMRSAVKLCVSLLVSSSSFSPYIKTLFCLSLDSRSSHFADRLASLCSQ